MTDRFTEIAPDQPIPPMLAKRLMAGEIIVVRQCLQRLDIFDEIRKCSINAVRDCAGPDVANKLDSEGLDTIHKHTGLAEIAKITDEIYKSTRKKCQDWVAKIAPQILGIEKSYYFESSPNVRFHVPYDVLAADSETLSKFAGARGGGKLAAHPNHRDSWVSCPDNLINVWIAVAPIPEGNGLTIFPNSFTRDLAHVGPSIAYDENPGRPLNFDLQPGDAILFQGDHLHSSVLNRTDRTRHAISFRIVTEKPNFPLGHFHRYRHSALSGGPLDMFAEVPANLAWTYFSTHVGWVKKRLGLWKAENPRSNFGPKSQPGKVLGGTRSFPLAELPLDTVTALNANVCVVRTGKKKVVAFGRRCPHGGADLSFATMIDGNITCPWHNLRFDPKSGKSACKTLRNVRLYDVKLAKDTVTISLDQ